MGSHHTFRLLACLIVVLLICSCQPEEDAAGEPFNVVIRLGGEPDNLNPLRSKSSYATGIESLMMPPLAEYDPSTLELTPLLIKSLARASDITDGPYAGGQRFSYEIREEASWSDGKPVTGEDYLFTLKAAMNPLTDAAIWRAYLSFIKDVEVDPDDPRKFDVIVQEPYMLAEAITCNFNILPKHIYDPEGLMDTVPLARLTDEETVASYAEGNAAIEAFAEHFAKPEYNRDIVSGAGAYELKEWVTGQYILLERKENWWADNLEVKPALLNAGPDRIRYLIIPDEVAALAALKDGSCDLVSGVSASAFTEMRNDEQWKEQFDFLTPDLLRYRYLEVNTRNDILSDKNVRKALAYSIDYQAIINSLEGGVATRTVGPISPTREYYNRNLKVPDINIDTARQFLALSGWEDSDNDGTVDKLIDGVRTELEVDLVTTQSPAGQAVALIVKEGAAQSGIGIEIITKDQNGWRQARVKRDFELMPMQVATSPAPSDPYQSWHSDSDQPGGGNRSGFSNAEADRIIEEIRSATDPEARAQLYLEFQKILYEEQPAIFLYVPNERIIVNKRLEVKPSSRRPGYFENLFELRGV